MSAQTLAAPLVCGVGKGLAIFPESHALLMFRGALRVSPLKNRGLQDWGSLVLMGHRLAPEKRRLASRCDGADRTPADHLAVHDSPDFPWHAPRQLAAADVGEVELLAGFEAGAKLQRFQDALPSLPLSAHERSSALPLGGCGLPRERRASAAAIACEQSAALHLAAGHRL